jgi:hypothetical protein
MTREEKYLRNRVRIVDGTYKTGMFRNRYIENRHIINFCIVIHVQLKKNCLEYFDSSRTLFLYLLVNKKLLVFTIHFSNF